LKNPNLDTHLRQGLYKATGVPIALKDVALTYVASAGQTHISEQRSVSYWQIFSQNEMISESCAKIS